MNQAQCSECGAALTAGSPGGLCARCMLKRGLEANTLISGEESAPGRAHWTPPTVEEVGMRFAELEVQELIGRGGMGAVYKAKQKNLDRVVALKILPPEIGKSGEFAERFAREAQAMAKLSHPHIVPIHDFGQRGNFYYFIMEYMDGLNLRQLMSTGNVSPKEALAIVPQICEALQYAHDKGIVHRDIKPENILLNKQGEVKIADFGLAKLMGPAATSGTERVCGTPQYMAPEQVNRPAEVDHRADIYSLGVVFYQMLTGQLPTQSMEPPSKRVQIDVRLDQIVLRALDQSPQMRYQNATQLKTEVETVRSAPVVEYASPRPNSRFSRTAIVGVIWAVLFFLVVPAFLVHEFKTHEFWRNGPFSGKFGMDLISLFIILPAFLAPFGVTILGTIAIAQIRRSAGRIYGLGMALFDVLLFPLMLLDAAILFGVMVYVKMLLSAPASTAGGGSVTMTPGGGVPVGLGLILCIVVDWIIVKRSWRAVNRPVDGGVVESRPAEYWFKAKKYGWGWGAPANWQGWAFILGWTAFTITAVCWVGNHHLPLAYVILTLMSALLMIVMFTKGEPPRWRWGDEQQKSAEPKIMPPASQKANRIAVAIIAIVISALAWIALRPKATPPRPVVNATSAPAVESAGKIEATLIGQWEITKVVSNEPDQTNKSGAISFTQDHKYSTLEQSNGRINKSGGTWSLVENSILRITEEQRPDQELHFSIDMRFEISGDVLVLHAPDGKTAITFKRILAKNGEPADLKQVLSDQIQSELQILRQQLELYKIQHTDKNPTLAQLQNAWSVLTTRTDVDGNIKTDGQFGPYIMGQPVNPILRLGYVAPAGKAWSRAGWTYDEKTMRLKAVVSEEFYLPTMSPEDFEKIRPEIEREMKDIEEKTKRTSDLLSQINGVVASFWLGHERTYPTLEQLAPDWELFLKKSDAKGNVIDGGELGPYLLAAPANPFTGKTKLCSHEQPSDEAGWSYDEKTHVFRLVAPGGMELGTVREEQVDRVVEK